MTFQTLFLILLSLLAPSAPGSGDRLLEGRVTDEADRGLPGVRVEWIRADGPTRLASTNTDGRWAFDARSPGEQGPREGDRVVFTRLGHESAEVFLSPEDRRIDVSLPPSPFVLPGIEVRGDPVACTDPDDEGARNLWEAMARQHLTDLDTLGVASYTLARTDTVPGPSAVAAESSLDDLVEGQRSSAPLLRIGWEGRVDRQGYAFPVRRTNREGSYDSWSYAPLEADFTGHFASSSFATHHRFVMARERSDGGWTLRFCPAEERRPALEGTMALSPDTALARVEWHHVTPDPDEGAGGWARFDTLGPESPARRLLPRESVTWRALPGEQLQRRVQWFEEWHVAPGDSVPFLPRRPNEGSATPGPDLY